MANYGVNIPSEEERNMAKEKFKRMVGSDRFKPKVKENETEKEMKDRTKYHDLLPKGDIEVQEEIITQPKGKFDRFIGIAKAKENETEEERLNRTKYHYLLPQSQIEAIEMAEREETKDNDLDWK